MNNFLAFIKTKFNEGPKINEEFFLKPEKNDLSASPR